MNSSLHNKQDIYVTIFTVSAEENSLGHVVLLTIEKVLELIESAYPNPITVHDIAK